MTGRPQAIALGVIPPNGPTRNWSGATSSLVFVGVMAVSMIVFDRLAKPMDSDG
jgi:hypothetical protein